MLKILHRFGLLLAAACALSCATTVRSRDFPALQERGAPITRVAIAPFEATGRLAATPESTTGTSPEVATALVARYLTEALASRGIAVVPADDVARALGIERPIRERLVPRAIAERAADKFGVDAVLMGRVSRFTDRAGQSAGTLRPASVGFEVTLYAAPGGHKLWSALFDETQRALSENVFNAGRYPGGGTRWLSAEELARWGASETAAKIPIGG